MKMHVGDIYICKKCEANTINIPKHFKEIHNEIIPKNWWEICCEQKKLNFNLECNCKKDVK